MSITPARCLRSGRSSMADSGRILINPPASQLTGNAVLWGRGRSEYHCASFAGPLSLKAMRRGTGDWVSGKRRYRLDPAACVTLNRGQEYSVEIERCAENSHGIETFCLFFEAGLVEDAYRTMTTSAEKLMDYADRQADELGFFDCIHPHEGALGQTVDRVHTALVSSESVKLELAWLDAAAALARTRSEVVVLSARIPAVRTATRIELLRRLLRAKALLDDGFDQPLTLDSVARESCLSPFHLHRAFRAAFGETPHQYLLRRRLERAAGLLRHSDIPVSGIALLCGRESVPSFTSAFRQQYGVSPLEYRRSQIRKIR